MSLSIVLSPFTGNIQVAKPDTVVTETTQEENKSEDKIPGVMTVAEFDDIIKASGVSALVVVRNKKVLLYQREFVKRVGYENLINLYNSENEYREEIKELFTNEKALSQYIETGLADNGASYIESVKNFAKIYNKHKEDFKKDPEFLLKLAVSISWSHAKTVKF